MSKKVLLLDYSEFEREKSKIILSGIDVFEYIDITNLDDFNRNLPYLPIVEMILLDINFPTEVDGNEVLAKLRLEENFKNVSIVIITKSNRETSKITSMNYNAKDYIIKPYQPKRLETSVLSFYKTDYENSYEFKDATVISMSVDNYISKELKMAERTNRSLSIVLISSVGYLISKSYKLNVDENTFRALIDKSLNTIKLNSRFTDTVILNNQTDIIALLPCTDSCGANFFIDKIKAEISSIFSSENIVFSDLFYISFVTFPNEEKDINRLMSLAMKKINDQIKNNNISSYNNDKNRILVDSYNIHNISKKKS